MLWAKLPQRKPPPVPPCPPASRALSPLLLFPWAACTPARPHPSPPTPCVPIQAPQIRQINHLQKQHPQLSYFTSSIPYEGTSVLFTAQATKSHVLHTQRKNKSPLLTVTMNRLPAAADSRHCAGSVDRSKVKQETGRPIRKKKPPKVLPRWAQNWGSGCLARSKAASSCGCKDCGDKGVGGCRWGDAGAVNDRWLALQAERWEWLPWGEGLGVGEVRGAGLFGLGCWGRLQKLRGL